VTVCRAGIRRFHNLHVLVVAKRSLLALRARKGRKSLFRDLIIPKVRGSFFAGFPGFENETLSSYVLRGPTGGRASLQYGGFLAASAVPLNRTDTAEFRAPERNGPFGEERAGLAD
jgi:hypothetical protein